MTYTIRFKTQWKDEREKLISVFASNGYKTWIENPNPQFKTNKPIYVCVEIPVEDVQAPELTKAVQYEDE